MYDAYQQELYYASQGNGAFKNDQPLTRNNSTASELALIADHSFAQFSYCPQIQQQLQQFAQQQQLHFRSQFIGGSVMNALWVCQHAMGCFFKFPKATDGGGCIWDFAASCCIAQEMGISITDIHGAPLELNRADSVYMNHKGVIVSSQAVLATFIQQLYQANNIQAQ